MTARTNILNRLRTSLAGTTPRPDDFDEALVTRPWQYSAKERITRLRRLMEAVHTEVHLTSQAAWPTLVAGLLAERDSANLLYAPATPHGRQLQEAWRHGDGYPDLRPWDRPIEAWKTELFHEVSASLTGTVGAIAATGSLVLWPDHHEPRLMSLVPPLHIALVKASAIHDNLYQVMVAHNWSGGLPTNVLLVSGPSKTADIEQVLAYGAHGPRELITLILQDA